MKRNVSLLVFAAIGTIVFLASYRSKEESRFTPIALLTAHTWTFEKAESLNSKSEYVINTVYENTQLNFTTSFTYHGEFFERPVQGTWQFVDAEKLVLNQGTRMEEQMEIAELTDEILRVRIIERGASVTLTYR